MNVYSKIKATTDVAELRELYVTTIPRLDQLALDIEGLEQTIRQARRELGRKVTRLEQADSRASLMKAFQAQLGMLSFNLIEV